MTLNRITTETIAALANLNSEQKLWSHWLDESPSAESPLPLAFRASEGLASLLKDSPTPSHKSLPAAYAQQLIDDLDFFVMEPGERDLLSHSIQSLATGEARAVVTGQQPGFAGGPLYSFFKIATTVALARKLSQQGQPTVPVYWMGDDDDDWPELLDPILWDGLQGQLLASHLKSASRGKRQDMIGDVPCSALEDRTKIVMERFTGDHSLGLQLQDIYQQSTAQGENLSLLTEKLLRCVFAGTGLVIVRGNDPRLHAQCFPFYEKAIKLRPELARLTQEQGRCMAEDFGVEALSPNSISRPLYTAEGSQRTPWDGTVVPKDTSTFRCGVLLRSMLQDWLLQPLSVVVGPGELAYLSQLVPAYKLMGLERSPLLPRLFGWIYPSGFSKSTFVEFTKARPLDGQRCQELALQAGTAGQEQLVQILMDELNLDRTRSQELAAGRTRRWVKGVQALLKNESKKEFEKNRPTQPAWVFPLGKRQERKLAWIPVMATWGQPLVEAVLDGCERHLQNGLEGAWQEYGFGVPLPENWDKEGSG